MKSMSKKLVLVLIFVAIIAVIAVSLNAISKKNETKVMDTTPVATEKEENPTKNDENINGLDKPIFMYFVTNKDLEDKTTKEALAKLQAEYKDRVIFEIRNADEDKSLYDNFPLDAGMPMLIMQKAGGDISNFLFANNNYDDLKSAIDQTL